MLTLITWKEPHDNWATSYRISGMQKILIASQAVPENHWSRVQVLESLKQISEDAGYEQETEAYEMQIQSINENIYGKKTHSDSMVIEE